MKPNTPLFRTSPRTGFSHASLRVAFAALAAWAALAGLPGCGQMQAQAVQSPPQRTAQDGTAPKQTIRDIQGLWVWRTADFESNDARISLIGFCKQWGYNRLLVQIHRQRTGDRNALLLPDALKDLIAKASEAGVAVEALDGGPDMAFAQHHERTLAQLDAIIAFNNTLPQGQRFIGVHYDIEPYTHADFKRDQASRDTIMQDLLVFYDKAKAKLVADGNGLLLAADIPFWYDNRVADDNHCIVTHQGQRKNLHEHIQDICDYIGVMSYRRHAQGSNSVTSLIQNELDYARKIGKTITPALETIELKEAQQISFYGQPASMYLNTLNELNTLLKNDPAFGGLLTHSYTGVKAILENAPAESQEK